MVQPGNSTLYGLFSCCFWSSRLDKSLSKPDILFKTYHEFISLMVSRRRANMKMKQILNKLPGERRFLLNLHASRCNSGHFSGVSVIFIYPFLCSLCEEKYLSARENFQAALNCISIFIRNENRDSDPDSIADLLGGLLIGVSQ